MPVVGSESSSSSDPGLFSIVAVKIFSFINSKKFHSTEFHVIKVFLKHSYDICFVYNLSPNAIGFKIYNLSVLKKNFVALENNKSIFSYKTHKKLAMNCFTGIMTQKCTIKNYLKYQPKHRLARKRKNRLFTISIFIFF